MASLDRRVFSEVAEALFSANHTFSFGMGVSAHLAELLRRPVGGIGGDPRLQEVDERNLELAEPGETDALGEADHRRLGGAGAAGKLR